MNDIGANEEIPTIRAKLNINNHCKASALCNILSAVKKTMSAHCKRKIILKINMSCSVFVAGGLSLLQCLTARRVTHINGTKSPQYA